MNRLLMKMALALGLGVAWHQTGNLALCWLFWLMVLAVMKPFCHNNLGMVLIIAGLTMNAIVILLNNGVMPVVGMASTIQPLCPIWSVATTGSKLTVLADQQQLWYFSVGDLWLMCGAVLAVWRWEWRKARV